MSQKSQFGAPTFALVTVLSIFSMGPNCGATADYDCWLENPELREGTRPVAKPHAHNVRFDVSREDIDLVVRTTNVESGLKEDGSGRKFYPRRTQGIAKLLHQSWPYDVGLIGMQEARHDITNCKADTFSSNGVRCFANLIHDEYGGASPKAYRTERDLFDRNGSVDGIIVGDKWNVLAKNTYEIDPFWAPAVSRRYLLEVVLRHVNDGSALAGKKLRFYNVHFYNATEPHKHSDFKCTG